MILNNMSGFNAFIKRSCKQVAVYWGNPQDDGFGGRTFDAPVEIYVRWDDREQLLTVDEGEKVISRAILFLSQDLNVNGLIYKGGMTDFTAEQLADPQSISSNICLVKRMERYPSLIGLDDIIYKAFLTPWLT
jgi:hypothetical protein